MSGGASPKQVTAEMGLVSEKPRGLCFGGVSVSVCACADLAEGLLGCGRRRGRYERDDVDRIVYSSYVFSLYGGMTFIRIRTQRLVTLRFFLSFCPSFSSSAQPGERPELSYLSVPGFGRLLSSTS
jgi:hypothetical protein